MVVATTRSQALGAVTAAAVAVLVAGVAQVPPFPLPFLLSFLPQSAPLSPSRSASLSTYVLPSSCLFSLSQHPLSPSRSASLSPSLTRTLSAAGRGGRGDASGNGAGEGNRFAAFRR